MVPSEPSMWARRIPSYDAPIRSIAARERALRASVFNVMRHTPQTSKAYVSSSSFISVLTGDRCTDCASQVLPISAVLGVARGPRSPGNGQKPRSRKRVEPMTRDVAASSTAKGRDVPAACSASASCTYAVVSARSAGTFVKAYVPRSSAAAASSASACASSSCSSRTYCPVNPAAISMTASRGGGYRVPGRWSRAFTRAR